MSNVVVKDLDLHFGPLEVLQKLSLEIKSGEFLVLLGSSGCGKSTLLNCIAGLLDITDGQVFIGDKNVTWAEPAKRGIGMVFQSYALYPRMTVRGNMSFGLKNARMPKAEIKERVDRAAEILQITQLLDRRPAALSGGQRQRVAIGRALVRDAEVFLFDEPLSNLDAKLRAELRVELKRLHANLGNTMIYVTHDQVEALTLADRIAVMKGGAIQQLDTPSNIYNRPETLYVAKFVGSPQMNLIEGEINGGTNAIFTADGLNLDLSSYKSQADSLASGAAIVGIRPEHFEVSRSEIAGGLEATVDLFELMGADNILDLQVGIHPMRVRVDGDQLFAVGDKVWIKPDMARASLFDPTTEQRL